MCDEECVNGEISSNLSLISVSIILVSVLGENFPFLGNENDADCHRGIVGP